MPGWRFRHRAIYPAAKQWLVLTQLLEHGTANMNRFHGLGQDRTGVDLQDISSLHIAPAKTTRKMQGGRCGVAPHEHSEPWICVPVAFRCYYI